MKRLILIYFILISLGQLMFAQEQDVTLIPYKKADKWGFCDIQKNIVVHPELDEIRYDNIVRKGNKWAILNLENGKLFTDFEYDDIDIYFLATDIYAPPYYRVVKNGKEGIVDTCGNVMVPCVFESILTEYEQAYKPYDSLLFIAMQDKKCQLINSTGLRLNTTDYDTIVFINGWILAEKSGLWGYLNDKGAALTEFSYDKNTYDLLLSPNFFFAPIERQGIYGYINKNGKMVFPMKFRDKALDVVFDRFIQDINHRYFIVKDENRYGCINENGDTVIPYVYSTMVVMRNDSGLVDMVLSKKDNEYFIFDTTWQRSKPLQYDSIQIPYQYTSRRVIARKGYKYGVVEIKSVTERDSILVPFDYNDISSELDGQFIVNKNGKYGLIDCERGFTIPVKYDFIRVTDTNFIRVGLGGKYGVVNRDNEQIIDIKYDNAFSYDGENIIVVSGKKQGCYNKHGKLIMSIIYDDIQSTNNISDRSECFIVKKNDKYGLMDISGKVLTPAKYNRIDRLYTGPFTAQTDFFEVGMNGLVGVITSKGKIVIPIEFSNIAYHQPGVYCVEKGNERYYMNISGIRYKD